MAEMANALPAPFPMSAGQRKGRARGGLICGFFGAAWVFEAVFFGYVATPAWLTVATLATIFFMAWPVVELRFARHMPYSADDLKLWASVSKRYWVNTAVEWLLCAVAVNWLVYIRRYDLIPQWLGVIIGLHFLPLARWFTVPVYYATGAAMILGSLASFWIPAGNARMIASCLVNGLALWTTAAVNLSRIRLSANGKAV